MLAFPGCRELSWSYIRQRLTPESMLEGECMKVPVEPIFTLIMGILILLVPRLLNYFVAVYLIIIGLLGLLNKVYL